MKARAKANRRRAQSGYALLMVVFMAALMIIAAAAIQTNILTQGRREKEAELIWRGQQYARGVRLFYRKNNRFPTSMDDLVKPRIGVRFMRKAYTDPMNPADGSWRLLYVGPLGQIIGSVKANPGGSPLGGGIILDGAPGETASAQGQAKGSSTTRNASSQTPGSQASALGTDGTIIGGNIIGVASKINRPSIKIYDTGTTYREWEFIYNPAKDVTVVGQQGVVGGTPNNSPGTNQNAPQKNPPSQNPQ